MSLFLFSFIVVCRASVAAEPRYFNDTISGPVTLYAGDVLENCSGNRLVLGSDGSWNLTFESNVTKSAMVMWSSQTSNVASITIQFNGKRFVVSLCIWICFQHTLLQARFHCLTHVVSW